VERIMSDERAPSPAFRLYSAFSIAWPAFVAWWAFLIVGPERYSLAQWTAITLGPPLAVIVRGFYMRWLWGRYTRWFWGLRR
jgi:hypothetical protein